MEKLKAYKVCYDVAMRYKGAHFWVRCGEKFTEGEGTMQALCDTCSTEYRLLISMRPDDSERMKKVRTRRRKLNEAIEKMKERENDE